MRIIKLTMQPAWEGDAEGSVGIRADTFLAAWDHHDTLRVGTEEEPIKGTMICFGLSGGGEPGSRFVRESLNEVLAAFSEENDIA